MCVCACVGRGRGRGLRTMLSTKTSPPASGSLFTAKESPTVTCRTRAALRVIRRARARRRPPGFGAGAGGDGDLRLPVDVGQRALHGGVVLLRGARALSAAGSGVRCARALTGFRGGVRWRMPEGRSTVGTCVGETQGEGCVWQESPRAREHRPPAGPSLALAATASDCPAGFVRGRVSRAAPAKRRCGSDLYGKGGSAGGRTSASAPPSLWKPMEAVTRSLPTRPLRVESASIFLSGFCSGGFFALRECRRVGRG